MQASVVYKCGRSAQGLSYTTHASGWRDWMWPWDGKVWMLIFCREGMPAQRNDIILISGALDYGRLMSVNGQTQLCCYNWAIVHHLTSSVMSNEQISCLAGLDSVNWEWRRGPFISCSTLEFANCVMMSFIGNIVIVPYVFHLLGKRKMCFPAYKCFWMGNGNLRYIYSVRKGRIISQ